MVIDFPALVIRFACAKRFCLRYKTANQAMSVWKCNIRELCPRKRWVHLNSLKLNPYFCHLYFSPRVLVFPPWDTWRDARRQGMRNYVFREMSCPFLWRWSNICYWWQRMAGSAPGVRHYWLMSWFSVENLLKMLPSCILAYGSSEPPCSLQYN